MDAKPIPNVVSLTLAGWAVAEWEIDRILDFSLSKSIESIEVTDTNIHNLPLIPSTIRHMRFDKSRKLRNIGDLTGTEGSSFPLLETFTCPGTLLCVHWISFLLFPEMYSVYDHTSLAS